MAIEQQAELALQERMVALVRAFGLHRPDETPCGAPVAVSEAHALAELVRREALSQNELAARLRLKKSTVSRLVGQLAARGWVERERDPCDGRAVSLLLTERGADAAAKIAAARARKFAAVLEQIPDDERDGVLRALDVLTEAMDASP
ncbi:MAG: MarR family transcriptional regulator [Gaiellaceae bacterium MAG52_C11]|nr:MarR family transcriptional regulator [Candidatus Gaiellasilicea maunaloa]